MSDQLDKALGGAELLKQSLRNSVEQFGLPELNALIEFATSIRQQKQEAAQQALIAEFRERAAAVGLSFEALAAPLSSTRRVGKPKAGTGKLPVKFRGPGGEEWSGRGRPPTWLAALEGQGKKREDYAV